MEYYFYTDTITHGWGSYWQDIIASSIWYQDQSHQHINVIEPQTIWLGLHASAREEFSLVYNSMSEELCGSVLK